MQLTDPRWIDKWSKTRFLPRPRDFSAAIRRYADGKDSCLFGSDDEPASSLWLASLSEAMGESFREGLTVLDYGCGAGRYAHFLRQRLKAFRYDGLEKPGSVFQHGEKSVKIARTLFRWVPRIRFDLIGSRLETVALARAEIVVLGSVFTHVDLEELRLILRKLQPAVARGGKGAYGFENCYERVWYTARQLRDLYDQNGWVATERETFVAQDVNVHRIFALRCAPEATR